MKHPQFRPREFRLFIEPTRPLPKTPAPVVPLTLPQALRALSLSVQSFLELNPFKRVFHETALRASGGGEWVQSRPTFFVADSQSSEDENGIVGDVFVTGVTRPKPEFVLDVSPPGFRGWRDEAVKYVEHFGVSEVFFFVPEAPSHLSFRAFRMKAGELAVVGQWSKLWHSSTLEIDFAVRDELPVAFNPRNGERLATPIDWFYRRFSK
jgi:hypothetical protein